MRLANVEGRACVVDEAGGFDLASASGDRFPSVPDEAIATIGAVQEWVAAADPQRDPALSTASLDADPHRLGPPVTRPGQVFAIGLNYRSHAAESGLDVPDDPLIFTKFPSSIAGPAAEVPLPSATVDWEVELVAVIGTGGRNISAADAFSHIAGFCVGQDISDRTLQMAVRPPQFSLGKSHENFAPIGPWLTTLDELADPTDLAIGCGVGDEELQSSRTSLMVFDIPFQVAYLSGICELRPGDVLFTGTPEGVGMGRTPPRFLEPGMELVSTIESLGRLRNHCRSG